MADNKRHHYVPRFYLERFSLDEKRLNLHNLRTNRTIYNASLKNQCYRNYFYGQKSHVEHALAVIEGNAATLFNGIDKMGCLPSPKSLEHLAMVLYILTQYARTLYTAQATNEQTDKLMKHLAGPKAEAEGIDLNDITIQINDPASYALNIAIPLYPILLDMDYKLLLNLSGEQIITSDNPVVLYNQFFSFRQDVSNTGVGCKGLQIFFPLDHEKLIMLYDHDVYGVGSPNKGVIKIMDRQDVYSLNTLQMCSASENVYFRDSAIDIAALRKKANPFLRNHKVNLDLLSKEKIDSGHSELITIFYEDIRTNLSLSFVRITKSAKRWREEFCKATSRPAVIARNQKLCNDNEEFIKLVNKGEYKPLDFYRYLEDKYKRDGQQDSSMPHY
jgi:hypothetical protein